MNDATASAGLALPAAVSGPRVHPASANVTAAAAALCLKAGNAVILRGGSESRRSAVAIRDAMQAGLAAAGLPAQPSPGARAAVEAAAGGLPFRGMRRRRWRKTAAGS